jgi:hypothetical protein
MSTVQSNIPYQGIVSDAMKNEYIRLMCVTHLGRMPTTEEQQQLKNTVDTKNVQELNKEIIEIAKTAYDQVTNGSTNASLVNTANYYKKYLSSLYKEEDKIKLATVGVMHQETVTGKDMFSTFGSGSLVMDSYGEPYVLTTARNISGPIQKNRHVFDSTRKELYDYPSANITNQWEIKGDNGWFPLRLDAQCALEFAYQHKLKQNYVSFFADKDTYVANLSNMTACLARISRSYDLRRVLTNDSVDDFYTGIEISRRLQPGQNTFRVIITQPQRTERKGGFNAGACELTRIRFSENNYAQGVSNIVFKTDLRQYTDDTWTTQNQNFLSNALQVPPSREITNIKIVGETHGITEWRSRVVDFSSYSIAPSQDPHAEGAHLLSPPTSKDSHTISFIISCDAAGYHSMIDFRLYYQKGIDVKVYHEHENYWSRPWQEISVRCEIPVNLSSPQLTDEIILRGQVAAVCPIYDLALIAFDPNDKEYGRVKNQLKFSCLPLFYNYQWLHDQLQVGVVTMTSLNTFEELETSITTSTLAAITYAIQGVSGYMHKILHTFNAHTWSGSNQTIDPCVGGLPVFLPGTVSNNTGYSVTSLLTIGQYRQDNVFLFGIDFKYLAILTYEMMREYRKILLALVNNTTTTSNLIPINANDNLPLRANSGYEDSGVFVALPPPYILRVLDLGAQWEPVKPYFRYNHYFMQNVLKGYLNTRDLSLVDRVARLSRKDTGGFKLVQKFTKIFDRNNIELYVEDLITRAWVKFNDSEDEKEILFGYGNNEEHVGILRILPYLNPGITTLTKIEYRPFNPSTLSYNAAVTIVLNIKSDSPDYVDVLTGNIPVKVPIQRNIIPRGENLRYVKPLQYLMPELIHDSSEFTNSNIFVQTLKTA